ncbi:MAG: DUF262 domain-containing protein [Ignavibacteriae bacterium]|nr:DUF262 domain-containing protein [Ignavibacteriota bacterium]
MAKKPKISDKLISEIDSQIRQESIPYDYDTREYPLEVLVEKYRKEEIFVPHYQRKFVWDTKRQSRFIESLFLGVPILPIFVSISGDEAELEIIDGSQRIRTLVSYMNDNLVIKNLQKITKLNDTIFSDLSPFLRNRFKLRGIRLHIVTEKANLEVRADIFDRLNTSSKPLSPSEIRKGSLQGKFYDFVLECAKIEKFQKLCPIPQARADRGEYEELILRFFAYSEKYLDFKHEVAPFLDDYVRQTSKRNFDKVALKAKLIQVMEFVENYFQPPYFARKGRDNATPRVRFEAISVGIHLALQKKPDLVPQYMDWLESDEFKDYTRSDASNNQGKLKQRVEFVRDCLLNIKDKNSLKYEYYKD